MSLISLIHCVNASKRKNCTIIIDIISITEYKYNTVDVFEEKYRALRTSSLCRQCSPILGLFTRESKFGGSIIIPDIL